MMRAVRSPRCIAISRAITEARREPCNRLLRRAASSLRVQPAQSHDRHRRRQAHALRFRNSRLTEFGNKTRGAAMSRELVAHNRPVFDHLHPKVYAGAVGLVFLLT